MNWNSLAAARARLNLSLLKNKLTEDVQILTCQSSVPEKLCHVYLMPVLHGEEACFFFFFLLCYQLRFLLFPFSLYFFLFLLISLLALQHSIHAVKRLTEKVMPDVLFLELDQLRKSNLTDVIFFIVYLPKTNYLCMHIHTHTWTYIHTHLIFFFFKIKCEFGAANLLTKSPKYRSRKYTKVVMGDMEVIVSKFLTFNYINVFLYIILFYLKKLYYHRK